MTPLRPSGDAAGPSAGGGVSSAEIPLALHVVDGEEVGFLSSQFFLFSAPNAYTQSYRMRGEIRGRHPI